jgi:hypothetical protein
MRYRAAHDGIELLRAFAERRKADRLRDEQRIAELMASLPTPERGVHPDKFDEVTSELLRLDILSELDAVVADLLKFCKKPGPVDLQLPALRQALRIGRGHAPSDTARKDKHVEIERAWIAAYMRMESDGKFRPERDVAEEIAKRTGVVATTVFNCWRALKERAPAQKRWSDRVSGRARGLSKVSIKKKALHLNKAAKPELSRIKFGKGRTTQ